MEPKKSGAPRRQTETAAAARALRARGRADHEAVRRRARCARVRVTKAYKMFVGGAFVRSESGRYFQVKNAPEHHATPIRRRSTSRAARARTCATPSSPRRTRGHGWEKRTAYNRGQILYRLAEVMESRRAELAQSLVRGGHERARGERRGRRRRSIASCSTRASPTSTSRSLRRSNPVAGPHFNFSVPGADGRRRRRRAGAPGAARARLDHPARHRGGQHGAWRSRASATRARRSCGASASRRATCRAACINILTGHVKELSPHLAKHREVIGIDAWIVDADLRKTVESEGADNVKRVKTHVADGPRGVDRRAQGAGPRLDRALPRDEDRLAPRGCVTPLTPPSPHQACMRAIIEYGYAQSGVRRLVEPLHVRLRRACTSSGAQVVVELRDGARAEDDARRPPSCARSHASATWRRASCRASCAISSSTSTTSHERSSPTASSCPSTRVRREPSGQRLSRARYLPERKPLRERRPHEHAEPEGAARGHDLALGVPRSSSDHWSCTDS